jgi:hypothetical protein
MFRADRKPSLKKIGITDDYEPGCDTRSLVAVIVKVIRFGILPARAVRFRLLKGHCSGNHHCVLPRASRRHARGSGDGTGTLQFVVAEVDWVWATAAHPEEINEIPETGPSHSDRQRLYT